MGRGIQFGSGSCTPFLNVLDCVCLVERSDPPGTAGFLLTVVSVAQLVERWTVAPVAVGSIPITHPKFINLPAAIQSLTEALRIPARGMSWSVAVRDYSVVTVSHRAVGIAVIAKSGIRSIASWLWAGSRLRKLLIDVGDRFVFEDLGPLSVALDINAGTDSVVPGPIPVRVERPAKVHQGRFGLHFVNSEIFNHHSHRGELLEDRGKATLYSFKISQPAGRGVEHLHVFIKLLHQLITSLAKGDTSKYWKNLSCWEKSYVS